MAGALPAVPKANGSFYSYIERYPAIVELTSAIYNAGPPTTISHARAQNLATDIESRIMAESTDVADYRNQVAKMIQELSDYELKAAGPADQAYDDKVGSLKAVNSSLGDTKNDRGAKMVERRTPHTWGRYERAYSANQGTFSRVFTAKVPEKNPGSFPGRPGDHVSLKVTYLAALVPPHNVEREIRILRKAVGPNIIALWESFRDGAGHLVLVFPRMPYNLCQLIEETKYPDSLRQSWLKDIFKGLAHIHSLGIIHRDIKTSNILLESPAGPAYLIDFGIAWCPGDPDSEPTDKKITDVGTVNYRPLEVLFGDECYGTSLDLWAAGCVVANVACFSNKDLFPTEEMGDSELALIQSIFESLGTPPEGMEHFRDWGKLEFNQHPPKAWSDIVPRAPPAARDLISRLVRPTPHERLTAQQALEHPYLAIPSVDQGEDSPLTSVKQYLRHMAKWLDCVLAMIRHDKHIRNSKKFLTTRVYESDDDDESDDDKASSPSSS